MLSEVFKFVLDRLQPIFKSAVEALIEKRPVAFSTAALFLIFAASLGYYSWSRADFYERTVERALSKRTENTPQGYKALESLILSNAETDDDGSEFSFRSIVGEAKFSSEFAETIEEFHRALASHDLDKTKPLFKISKPDVPALSSQRQQDAIITENLDLGFLFLPVRLLRLSEETYSGMAAQPETISDRLGFKMTADGWDCQPGFSGICDDVIATRRALIPMKKATSIEVTKDVLHRGISSTPAQVYYITENGVDRMVSQEGNDAVFYRNQFRASTIFPNRPYYVGAFKSLKSAPSPLLHGEHQRLNGKLQDYFYVSEPYLDIGGNGVVVTLARAFKYPGHSEGALCFDLRLERDQALGRKLTDLLDKLEGAHTPVKCTTTGLGDPICNTDGPGDSGMALPIKNLEEMLKMAKANNTRSDVIGGFAIVGPRTIDAKTSKAGFLQVPMAHIVHANDEIHFMVPIEPPKVVDPNPEHPTTELRFLAVTLSIGKYLQRTAELGFLSLVLLGVSIAIAVVAWAADAIKKADFRKQRDFLEGEKQLLHTALDNVSDVMLHSPTPYVRLDGEDHIINGNASLAAFFGLSGTPEAVETELKGTRFEDWISDDSRIEYHRVQDRRRKGAPVKPYALQFRTKNSGATKAWVYSSILPAASQQLEGALPETFGILVLDRSPSSKASSDNV